MPDVAMPRLSDSMEEGTILKWLKSDGDEVQQGEELVEIETDKANMTYEADADGVLAIVAQEGDTLSVGDTIARIGARQAEAEAGDGARRAEADGEDEADEEAEDEAPAEPQGESDEDEAEDEEPERAEGGDEAQQAEADEASEDHDEEADSDEGADNGRPAETPARAAAEAKDGSGNGGGGGRVKASPVARRMAREMGLELSGVEGSGPGGRIVKADVEAASRGGTATARAEGGDEARRAEAGEAPAEEEEAKPKGPGPVSSGGEGQTGRGEATQQDLTKLQQTVARRMAESKATAPEFVMTVEVDMDEAVALRRQLKAAAGDGVAPSFNDLVIKACALALTEFPRANGAYKDGRFELYSRVNVGVAVAGQDALVVPTVFDADKKSLGVIAREARALAERVREGTITPPELSAGTFTVSNLGMFGIKRFVAVINPPQAAILAIGEMAPRPVAIDGEVVIRHLMEITLSCDHRILYGADAAQFVGRVRERLESPMSLVL